MTKLMKITTEIDEATIMEALNQCTNDVQLAFDCVDTVITEQAPLIKLMNKLSHELDDANIETLLETLYGIKEDRDE